MVQPSYTKLADALHNVELTASMERLADALPFYHGSPTGLTKALINAAGENVRPDRLSDTSEIPPDILDLQARIIEYARDVSQHAGAGNIADEKSLIADFIWFLTKPLKIAERDVMKIEGRLLAELSPHEALSLTNIDFRTSDAAERAEGLLRQFIEQAHTYRGEIETLMRCVEAFERVFHDPEGIALKILNALHDMSGMITQLDDAVRMVLQSSENDIQRAKWLESLRTIFVDRTEPFSYVQKTYPQLHITVPNHELALPTFSRDRLRKIMNSLMRNAIAHGVQQASISLLSNNDHFATIGILFGKPGIPIDLQGERKDRLMSSDWYIMKNHLVPELGPGTAISCTPHIDKQNAGGTLVTLTLPLNPASPAPIPRQPRPPSLHSTEGLHVDGSVAGANSALAGALALSGGAQIIPLQLALIPTRPIGKV